jgi:putative tryptophan/tyrosine transport system substrate-binding protein
LVEGKNLTIHRTIIDFDLENPTFTKKINVYFRIKAEASRIAQERPDLVLTMGTPATKYSKDKIIAAGIPLEFTALAYPTAVGCKSLSESGQGFTGVTTHMNMADALKLVRKALPAIKTLGMVHSDDENSITHVEEAKKEGKSLGIIIISKKVGMKDRIVPALQELQKKGAQAFAVPPDPYYEIRNHAKAADLIDFSIANNIPAFSFVIDKIPGAVLYVGVDFEIIGTLSGQQALKILRDQVKPESLPIVRQQELTIMMDSRRLQTSGFQLPPEILRIAKPFD